MSSKIIPAIVMAILFAGTAAASAQSPSAEGAGNITGAYSNYTGYSGGRGYLYDYAPNSDYSPGSSATR
jgi:hypothetical protein